MQVRDGMSSVVLSIGPAHTLRDAARLMAKRRSNRSKSGATTFNPRDWPVERFVKDHGLYRLVGTIRYPGQAKAV